jgi:hypothetical protein
MGFLPNIKEMAIKEAEKAFEDFEKLPAVIIAQKDIADGFAELEALEAKITPQEIEAALNLLFPGRFTVTEIQNAEASLNKLIAAFTALRAALVAKAKAEAG